MYFHERYRLQYDVLVFSESIENTNRKSWILLYFVRAENEFSAECSLPEMFYNIRDISVTRQLHSTQKIGLVHQLLKTDNRSMYKYEVTMIIINYMHTISYAFICAIILIIYDNKQF